ncbi:hypothetical protein AUEXF2481DRAFT_31878 [Aureobasidium subglaciale EXF-2481]|uniref:Apple domain-containing protein n=1 Tax=Aureobasidium subglaciale (strain EXF-2481) TaxID=1043005 RepID=A0A074Z0N2_AURSE|nr:uncharacterized protein AUEXF2481DRAFT_31878 [Aureobasidium subglaciale EXF-2481]KEQ92626.1 hypothetical protein AUEXF2481DRAFT_31878 [Aureobasidium subglaciale EXF-2481]
MNREPVTRATITSNTQSDFASCVNACRNVGGCIGTSYVISSGLCTYFSAFTTVSANTGTNVAFPANITCPNLNGYSYLDSSGSEYGILCNQAFPASSNITTQNGYTSLATCSNACSFSAGCLASSFVNGQCTFVSNLNTNTNSGQSLPGAVMLVLLQSRAVEVISTTGLVSRSTSYSVVQGLPSAAAAVQKGQNPYDAVASAYLGCGNAFWQPRCATAAATSSISRFSTIYMPTTPMQSVAAPAATSSAATSRPTSTAVASSSILGVATSTTSSTTLRPTSVFITTSSTTRSSSTACSKLLGLIPVGC